MAVIRSPIRAPLRTPMKPPGTAALGLGRTSRRDRWWLAPGVQAVVFTVCATYLFVSGILLTPLFGTPYEVDGYLSPLFSPLIAPDWLPTWISPGLLILWIPLGFRATCYYYRKAYYRFYFADPPGCAVGEPTVHQRLQAGGGVPVHPPEPPPLLPVPRVHPAVLPLGRRGRVDRSRRAAASGSGSGVVRPVRQRRAAERLLAVVPLAAPHRRRQARLLLVLAAARRSATRLWQRLTSLNRHHMAWAWASLLVGDVRRRLRPAARARGHHRPGDPALIDATDDRPPRASPPRRPRHRRRRRRTAGGDRGGRGRGDRSGSSASRCSARPTRSWPRAASPRRSRHVDDRDSWQTHFRDTMVGGKMLNNPRMAQLHAQEAPDRVRELEALGRGLRPDPRRADPPAAVRRPHPSAARPRRRPDRPRDDPDAPGPRRRDRASRSTWSARSPT